MTSNPQNAVIVTGHSNGTVNMWTPNYASDPVVKMLAHPTTITNVSIDYSGRYMFTTGTDKKLKVWDLRNQYTQLYEYFTPNQPQCMSISQKGLLALGYKGFVEIWKESYVNKQSKPYLKHHFADKQVYANTLNFINFEDFLGVGTNKGYSQIVVPGSGEPNFDTYESNLFETKNQKKNSDVKKLLEKIPYSMIGINSEHLINSVNTNSKDFIEHQRKEEIREKTDKMVKDVKKKMRLKNKATHGLLLKEFDRIENNKKKFRSIIERSHDKVNKEKENVKDELNVLKKVDDNFDPELNLNESFSDSD